MTTLAEAITIAFQSYQSGNLEQAEGICRQILQQQPDQAVVLHLLGVILHQTGRLQEAIACYQRAIAIAPNYAEAYNSLAVVLQSVGDLEAAGHHLQRAIALQPNYVQAHFNLGNVRQDQGDLAAAIDHYQQAIALKPDYAQAHSNLGITLQQQGQLLTAITHFYLAIAYQPHNPIAHSNLGNALQGQGSFTEAIDHYQQALALQPQDAQTHYNLGNALRELAQLEPAIAHYQQALRLNPALVEAQINLGIAYKDNSQMAAAIAHLQSALELAPQNANAHTTWGDILLEQGKLAAATDCFERALAIDPHHHHAHCSRGFVQVLTGNFQQGYPEYIEHLGDWLHQHRPASAFSQPRWDGSDLQGQTILLVAAEAGFGDVIQFARYAPLVAARGGRVIAQAPPALVRSLQTLAGVEQVISITEPLPDFQTYIPYSCLPVCFQTSLTTVPTQPYLVVPAEGQDQVPGEVSGEVSGEKLKVGLVWAGAPRYRNIYRDRSCPLLHFQPLLELPDLAFYSLQVGERAADLIQLTSGSVQDLSDRLGDFADTAAAIVQLDLVITVDTAVAHLAGALAKPVWVLLPFAPDCRWMLDRSDSPWYPTMRLFRQPTPGDWAGAIAQVVKALQTWEKP